MKMIDDEGLEDEFRKLNTLSLHLGAFVLPSTNPKCCLTLNKYGIIDEHKTFESFTNVSGNVKAEEYFKMLDGDIMIAKVPLSWKKTFVVVLNFLKKKDILINVQKIL